MDSDNHFYDSLEEEDLPFTGQKFQRATSKSEVPPSKLKRRVGKTRTKYSQKSASPSCDKLDSSHLSQLLLKNMHKKSYIDLFHEKLGYVPTLEASETSRATCGDDDSFKTARSSQPSEYSDAETSSFVSDTSFYSKFLKNEKLFNGQLHSVSSISKSMIQSSRTASSANLSNSAIVQLNGRTKSQCSKGKPSKAILKVPTLGGLGPDPEASKDKLQNFKRQQRYGQKVSNQNRAKIMEMKVMKNFQYELKKSNELNKCAESVFSS